MDMRRARGPLEINCSFVEEETERAGAVNFYDERLILSCVCVCWCMCLCVWAYDFNERSQVLVHDAPKTIRTTLRIKRKCFAGECAPPKQTISNGGLCDAYVCKFDGRPLCFGAHVRAPIDTPARLMCPSENDSILRTFIDSCNTF